MHEPLYRVHKKQQPVTAQHRPRLRGEATTLGSIRGRRRGSPHETGGRFNETVKWALLKHENFDGSLWVGELAQLSKKVIDLDELRMLAAQGVPDGAAVRPTVWKLLLGYLPSDRALWEQELAKKRSQYAAFKEEFLSNPYSEIIEQIDRDVKRTHPDMHFFCGDSSFAKSNQESLKNILIIFAKLNAGIRYVQGMNEILAPLFFVFRNDPDDKNANFAEADSFFCFMELLSGFRDNFCQKLDNSAVGIQGTLSKLSQLVAKYDGELQRYLEITTEINPQFYAFRWITLLLTQEFNFADTIHIWDTLLSDPDGPQGRSIYRDGTGESMYTNIETSVAHAYQSSRNSAVPVVEKLHRCRKATGAARLQFAAAPFLSPFRSPETTENAEAFAFPCRFLAATRPISVQGDLNLFPSLPYSCSLAAAGLVL
ncbi:P0497A05.14 [Oryza sativa Japonica Group]|uniref:p0497A05.14 protein n=1 Tax=Oryza sativa subsp. japonica TaxID=39947 RepID=Q8L580_ORYSJ|nr:P0497A05.14 [Oryza sativa Japonica Group]